MSETKARSNGQSKAVSSGSGAPTAGAPAPGGYSYNAPGAANLVSVLNQYDLPADVERLVEAELNPDHILGNLNEAEVRYRRFSLWNSREMVVASFPPSESIWRGDLRKDVEGLGDGKEPLTQEQIKSIRDAYEAAFARVSRSRGGWQQKILAEQTQERRVVEEKNDDGGGFFSNLFGGGN